MSVPLSSNSSTRIEWLAILQGFSMLLVLLGHVVLTNNYEDPEFPIVAAMERIVYTFHMPLFIFISGWLFYRTCIGRGLSYSSMASKKLTRLGIPFLFFTVFTLIVKLLFASKVKRAVDMDELINTFVFFSSNPLEEMWFVFVLISLMMLYPIYRWLLKNYAVLWGLGAALVVFFVLPTDIREYRLSLFARMLPFFIAGIACCRYAIVEKYASKWYVGVVSLVLFILSNSMQMFTPFVHSKILTIFNASTGIVLSVYLCALLSRFTPGLFGSFREYTFQIFLLGIFFQMAIRYLYGAYGQVVSFAYPLLFIVSMLTAVYVPVGIARLVKRLPAKFRLPFGL